MKQFTVNSSPLGQIIGKVTRITKPTGASRYSIRRLGMHLPYLLCSEEDPRTGPRTIRYTSDPHLFVGDVLELSEGHCYVHISATSNDNCLIVSNECNERCINCPQLDRTKNPGLPERNTQLIRLFPKHLQMVALTGGEPAVDFHELLRIVRMLALHHPSIHIDVLTNGIAFADLSKAEMLATVLKQEQATFCITLYGDTPAIHDAHTQIAGSFAKVNAALHHLAFFGYTIELRYLITCMNYERLPSFIEYAYDNFPFVDHISIMGMEYCGDAAVNAARLFVACETYTTYLLTAVQKAVMRDIPVFIYNHQVCLLPKQLWRFTVASISDWKTGYSPRCEHCDVKGYCGGFFTTSNPDYIPTNLAPISLDYPLKEEA